MDVSRKSSEGEHLMLVMNHHRMLAALTLCLLSVPAFAQARTITYRARDGRVLTATLPAPAPVTLRQVRQQLDDATLALIALRRADPAAAQASPEMQRLAFLITNLEQQVQLFEQACRRATPGRFPVCE
jgi:hypothetical protein